MATAHVPHHDGSFAAQLNLRQVAKGPYYFMIWVCMQVSMEVDTFSEPLATAGARTRTYLLVELAIGRHSDALTAELCRHASYQD